MTSHSSAYQSGDFEQFTPRPIYRTTMPLLNPSPQSASKAIMVVEEEEYDDVSLTSSPGECTPPELKSYKMDSAKDLPGLSNADERLPRKDGQHRRTRLESFSETVSKGVTKLRASWANFPLKKQSWKPPKLNFNIGKKNSAPPAAEPQVSIPNGSLFTERQNAPSRPTMNILNQSPVSQSEIPKEKSSIFPPSYMVVRTAKKPTTGIIGTTFGMSRKPAPERDSVLATIPKKAQDPVETHSNLPSIAKVFRSKSYAELPKASEDDVAVNRLTLAFKSAGNGIRDIFTAGKHSASLRALKVSSEAEHSSTLPAVERLSIGNAPKKDQGLNKSLSKVPSNISLKSNVTSGAASLSLKPESSSVKSRRNMEIMDVVTGKRALHPGFSSKYKVGELLGDGAFGFVMTATKIGESKEVRHLNN